MKIKNVFFPFFYFYFFLDGFSPNLSHSLCPSLSPCFHCLLCSSPDCVMGFWNYSPSASSRGNWPIPRPFSSPGVLFFAQKFKALRWILHEDSRSAADSAWTFGGLFPFWRESGLALLVLRLLIAWSIWWLSLCLICYFGTPHISPCNLKIFCGTSGLCGRLLCGLIKTLVTVFSALEKSTLFTS